MFVETPKLADMGPIRRSSSGINVLNLVTILADNFFSGSPLGGPPGSLFFGCSLTNRAGRRASSPTSDTVSICCEEIGPPVIVVVGRHLGLFIGFQAKRTFEFPIAQFVHRIGAGRNQLLRKRIGLLYLAECKICSCQVVSGACGSWINAVS